MCRAILNRFFEVTSQSGELHLKTFSSSSKLGTTVATPFCVDDLPWNKKLMYFQKNVNKMNHWLKQKA